MEPTNASASNNPLERSLDLAVALDALEGAIEQRLRQKGRNLRMPGFRPGKVPFSIIKQQFDAEMRHEALSEALNTVFSKMVAEQKLNVAGFPRITPKENGNAEQLEFSAVFEVYPEFSLGSLEKASVERPVLEIAGADVDRTLDILRKQRGSYKAVDRAAAQEDRVTLDFLGTKDGTPFQGGKAENYPFILGQSSMLPDFEAAVKDMKSGESKTFDLTFPADYSASDLAGQTVQFAVTVKEVAGLVLPEINAEFAKALGVGDGDVAKMRAEIEDNLKREVKKRIEAKVKEQVMDALAEANPIPVPKVLIELEVRRLVQNARHDMEQRGIKSKEFPIQPEWFSEQAKRRVTLGLILAEATRAEKLEARPEQVKALIEEAAQTYENPAEVTQWYYAQPQRLSEVEALVSENNVVEWALSKMQVTEKSMSFDELMGRTSGNAGVSAA